MAEKTVLIYEKDANFNKALKLYFRGSPYEPQSVDALNQLAPTAKQKRPTVILVAFENDDGESRGVLKSLSSDDATRGLPVVVMSTKKTDRDLFGEGIQALGATAYIKKPFIKKAIIQLLDEVLANSPKGQSRRGGMDLGSVLNDVDQQLDDFFEKSGDRHAEEFSISLEDEGTPAPTAAVSAEPMAISLEEEGAPAYASAPVEVIAAAPVKEEPPPTYDAAELKRLRERIRELEEELRQKTEEFKTASREKERIEHSVGKKESELLDRIKTLEKQNEEHEEDIRKKKTLVAQMTASVQQLNDELEEKDRKHGKEIESWQTQLSKLQSQFDELQEKSSAQSHEIEDKTDEIARQKRRVEDLEGERNELQGNLERMTEAKNEGDRTIEGLRGDLASTRETLARTEQDLSTERSRIAAAKDSFEQGIGGLREALEREMTEAREMIDKGLAHKRESVERATQTARTTLDKGIDLLLGR